jgi:5-methylcytosine-specific restriction endonuclease McrA
MSIIWLAALLIPLLAIPSSAVSGRWGILPALAPRRWRWRYRRWRRDTVIPLMARPRGRQGSARISNRLRAMVMRADRHRCVFCGAQWERGMNRFPVDHMVPWIMGGLTCLWNCALLCKQCNTVKSAYWKAPSGKVYYHGGQQPPPRAALILAAEQLARRSPSRWLRAYGLLPSW